jgi:lipoate-protein ligase A
MPPLYVIHDPPLDGPTNMARDEHLLYGELRPAVLRLYAWTPPTISLGYFQRFADTQTLPAELRVLPVVRRPTGGGAILHDREITYCLVVDDSLDVARQPPQALYRLVHECWRQALAADVPELTPAAEDLPPASPRGGPFFCFEKAGHPDLLYRGRKLLGSAQRRIAGRVLQHGSLLLGRTFDAHPGASLGNPPAEQVRRWADAFIHCLADALGLSPQPTTWSRGQLADVQLRRQRYHSADWTRLR